jgi:hypothetical protein
MNRSQLVKVIKSDHTSTAIYITDYWRYMTDVKQLQATIIRTSKQLLTHIKDDQQLPHL